MAIRFAEADARPMGRTAYGVRGMQLREGDEVVAMEVVSDDGTLLTVCENGYGKRTRSRASTGARRAAASASRTSRRATATGSWSASPASPTATSCCS